MLLKGLRPGMAELNLALLKSHRASTQVSKQEKLPIKRNFYSVKYGNIIKPGSQKK